MKTRPARKCIANCGGEMVGYIGFQHTRIHRAACNRDMPTTYRISYGAENSKRTGHRGPLLWSHINQLTVHLGVNRKHAQPTFSPTYVFLAFLASEGADMMLICPYERVVLLTGVRPSSKTASVCSLQAELSIGQIVSYRILIGQGAHGWQDGLVHVLGSFSSETVIQDCRHGSVVS